MSAFAAYADYYDLLYRDKDYRGEAAFVRDLIHGQAPAAHDLLDLGCGTGQHAVAFAQLGFNVCGVDISTTMLRRARERLAQAPSSLRERVDLLRGDVRTCSLGRTFDAVVSLFHVMSYQTADADVHGAIVTARRHLKPGAPFAFDFWHAPAIAKDGPQRREKIAIGENIEIRRLTVPQWKPADKTVIIDYDMTVSLKSTGHIERFSERHTMRYFEIEELDAMLRVGGFEPLRWGEWLTHKQPGPDSFSVYAVACAV